MKRYDALALITRLEMERRQPVGHVDAIDLRIGIRISSKTNARGHWAKVAKVTKEQRWQVAWAWRVHYARLRVPLPAVVTFCRVAPQPLDDDNIRDACKSLRDQVAVELGLPSDRDKRVRWEYAQRRGKVREYAVEINIRSEKR